MGPRPAVAEATCRSFDLIVVGAGINDAGIARDLAPRDLRVLLVDKADIVSGVTSRSTRLIRRGLRYREHGGVDVPKRAPRSRTRPRRRPPATPPRSRRRAARPART